jgi:DNA-binding beta-propeller fold protein YncE
MQIEQRSSQASVGSGEYTYDVIENFVRLPAGMTMRKVIDVAVDKDDNVYAFVRIGSAPIMVFNRSGDFLGSWGAGQFVRPHGIHIGRDNMVYLSDDENHVVRKYTTEGKLLLTIGVPGQGSAPYSGEPFNRCTHTALSPENDIYISDGYGNARMHKYSQEGKHILSWGESGIDPGQFNIPHNVCCDDAGWVYVADRENHRVQVFNGNGKFESEWNHLHRPCSLTMDMAPDGLCYVGELHPALKLNAKATGLGPRVTVLTKDGKIVARLKDDDSAPPPTRFIIPHGMCVDSQGNIYMADPMALWSERFPDQPQPELASLKKLVKRASAG